MSIREQAKTIYHERLRAIPRAIPEEFIADITDGLEFGLSQLKLELQGERPVLNADQLELIENMKLRLMQTGLATQVSEIARKTIANGGGMVAVNSKVSPTAYVGIEAVFFGDMGDHAEFIDSRGSGTLGDFDNAYVVKIGKNSHVVDFKLVGDYRRLDNVSIGDNVEISHVDFEVGARHGSGPSGSNDKIANFFINTGARVSNIAHTVLVPVHSWTVFPLLPLIPLSQPMEFTIAKNAQIDFAGQPVCADAKQSVKISAVFSIGNGSRNVEQNDDISERCEVIDRK
ncbi:hypothetical protein WDW86_10555 [Bdellovibrionota bacterium FG-2]